MTWDSAGGFGGLTFKIKVGEARAVSRVEDALKAAVAMVRQRYPDVNTLDPCSKA